MADRKSTSATGRQGGTARKGAVKKTAKKRTEPVVTGDALAAPATPATPVTAATPATPQLAAAAVAPVVRSTDAAPAATQVSAPKVTNAGELVEVKKVDGDVLDRIRWQAYQIWRERGGDPMENWLEAERRVAESR